MHCDIEGTASVPPPASFRHYTVHKREFSYSLYQLLNKYAVVSYFCPSPRCLECAQNMQKLNFVQFSSPTIRFVIYIFYWDVLAILQCKLLCF